MNIQDKNVQELTDAELQALLKAKGRLAKKVAQREIDRRKKLSQARGGNLRNAIKNNVKSF